LTRAVADCLGNAVTGATAAQLAAIDDFLGGLVASETRIAHILDAAKGDRVPVLVAVYAGILHMLAETTGQEDAARPWLEIARTAAARTHLTEREEQWIAVLDPWCAGDIDATITALDQLLGRHPRDLAALKLLHYHQFNRGQFADMLRAALGVQKAAGDLPYLGGMLAFAHEQLHLLDDAEHAATQGLALVPNDPWAQHALAHVWLTRGSITDGLAALVQWSPGWVGLNSFMVTHLWWHLALFYLARGHFAEALAIHDTHVWGHDRSYSQDQINAVSLLARLELAGVDVGDRWSALAPWLIARATDTVLPFLSVQYAYGLARAGRPEADTLLAAMAERDGDRVWHEAALPLAQGLVAHARREFPRALRLLSEAVPRLAHLGGSHAQRDLFALVLIDAQINGGALGDAQQALALRRANDPHNVPVNAALAAIHDALGLPEQGAAARARIGT
jgi:hypothetical protein